MKVQNLNRIRSGMTVALTLSREFILLTGRYQSTVGSLQAKGTNLAVRNGATLRTKDTNMKGFLKNRHNRSKLVFV